VCVCDRLTVNEEITQAAVENPNNIKWEKTAKNGGTLAFSRGNQIFCFSGFCQADARNIVQPQNI